MSEPDLAGKQTGVPILDLTGPSECKLTRASPAKTGTPKSDRRLIITRPIKLSVPVHKSSEGSGQIEGMELDTVDCDEIEGDLDEDDVVCIEEEQETKTKFELGVFGPMSCPINLETLKRLLLFGVEATIEYDRKLCWPPMTMEQKATLRGTYQTMLDTVPLVRELDRSMLY